MKNSVLFLGTGASMGTPAIGCKCQVCSSKDKKNKRLRSSILLKMHGKNFLIDVSPDFRQTALMYQISDLDGVFLTHFHENHVGGMNDLRPLFFMHNHKPLPLILSENTLDIVQMRFSYLMNRFDLHIIKDLEGVRRFCEVEFCYFTYYQNSIPVNGFRFGDFAYITDIKDYSDEIFQKIKGVKVLVLSLLQEEGTAMHFSYDEAIDFIEKSGAIKCYLTHISHAVSHEEMNKKLPSNIELAFDGLELTL